MLQQQRIENNATSGGLINNLRYSYSKFVIGFKDEK